MIDRAESGVAEVRPKRDLGHLFPGPRPFDEKEQTIFFGRSREKKELRALLQAYRTTLLHAQSGAGKTSLVRAGLLPLLAAEHVSWTRCRVGAPSLGGQIDPSHNAFVSGLLMTGFGVEQARVGSLANAFESLGNQTEHVLILDQFEEFFTSYPNLWADREPFFRDLSQLLEDKERLRILFVIREEFVSRLEPFAHHLPEEFQIKLFLERLRTEQAKEAVTGPFAAEGITFESEQLIDSFVGSLGRQVVNTGDGRALQYQGEFVEPVQLQVVCQALALGIAKSGIDRITSAEISTYGNADRSLTHFYDDTIKHVSKEQRVGSAKLRRWFEQCMITPGGTRGTVFMGKESTEGLSNKVVKALESGHLIRSEQRAGAVWYEITHDLLLAPIQLSNRLWKIRRNKNEWLGFALLILLIAIAGGTLWISSRTRGGDETKQLVTDTRKEENQLTTKQLFERALVDPNAASETRNEQQTTADSLADFLTTFSADGQGALQNLTGSLDKLWAKNQYQTVKMIDAALQLFYPPKPEDSLAWPPVTEELRSYRRSLLANLAPISPQDEHFLAYIRSHNSAVVIVSPRSEGAEWELKHGKGAAFPGAIFGKPESGKPESNPETDGTTTRSYTPVIGDYFLSCDDASALVKEVDDLDKTRPYIISYYSKCPPCKGQQHKVPLFPLPVKSME